MDCLPSQLPPGKILMDFLCSLPGSLSPYMLSLFLVSQFSLGPSLYQGFLFRLLRRGGLLLRLVVFYSGLVVFCFAVVVFCSSLVIFCSAVEIFCSALVVSSPIRSALVGSCSVCSALVGSSPIRSALVGSCSVCSALVGPCSVCPVLASGSALAPNSVGFTLVFCSALVLCPVSSASIPSLSTSTWTMALSRIRSMNFRSLTTRGHSLTTLTLALHSLLHFTTDYNSHHPLH